MWQCLGSRVSGVIACVLGKFTEARVHSEKAVSSWDPSYRSAAAAPADPHVSALLYLSRTLLCLGYIDQARFQREDALAEARRLSPFTLAYGLYVAWASHWAIEGTKAASTILRSADEVLSISSEQGFPLFSAFGNIMRGWSMGALGQANEGVQSLLHGLAIYRSIGAQLALPFVLITLAETQARAGQHQESLTTLGEAARVTDYTRERWAEAEMYRVQGMLLLSLHQDAEAEDNFHRALAVTRDQSAKFWELRAATSLAQLWCNQGKYNAARELLRPIYEWFTEGFETAALLDANELLRQMRDRHAAEPPNV
jgi:predicted ATPase